jgi:MYXO-CTERM domain-containing protein
MKKCLLALAVALTCTASVFAAGADHPTDPIPVIAPLPFTDTGDTTGAANDLTDYAWPDLPFPYGGEDHIYQINLGEGNNVAFTLDLTGSAGDLAIFLRDGLDAGASTVAGCTDFIGPGAGPEIIEAASYAPGTYYLWIDSYYDAGTTASAGTYTLNVTGTLPEPASFALLALGGLAMLRRR